MLSFVVFLFGIIWLKLNFGLGSKFMISELIEFVEIWFNIILF